MSILAKPLPGTPINYDHPLCPLNQRWTNVGGLIIPFNEGSGPPRALVGAIPINLTTTTGSTERLGVIAGGTPKWNPHPAANFGTSQWAGPTFSTTGSTDSVNFGASSDFIPLDEVTIVVGYRKRDATLRAGVTFGIGSATVGHQCKAYTPFTDGKIYWDFGGNVLGTSRITYAGATFGDDVYAFVAGTRGMEIWQNGVLLTSQTGHAVRQGNSNDFYLGVCLGITTEADFGDHAFLYIYPRQLEWDEIHKIMASPFCFYDWGEDELLGPQTVSQSLAGTLTTAGTLSTIALRKRLWFDSVAPAAASPSFDAGWSSTAGAVRRRMNHVKSGSAIAAGSIISWASTAGTKALDRQYISAPLDGDQAISGTVKMQLQVREENNNDNVDQMWLTMKVVSIDGATVRGTLLSHGNYGPTGEFISTSPAGVPQYRNKTGADGDALTLVNALNGDRILVEIGYSNSTLGASPEARALWGENASDLAENETTTSSEAAGSAGWIQFSTALVFRDATALSLAGGLTLSGGLVKQVDLPLSGTLGPVGTLTPLRANKISVGGGLTPAGTALVLNVKLLSNTGGITPAGSITQKFGRGVAAAGNLTPAGSLKRSPGRAMSGALTISGRLIKQAGLVLGGELIPAGAAIVLHLINLAAAGSLSLAGSLANIPGKFMGGTLTVMGNLIKRVGKYLTGALVFLGVLRRGVGEAPCAYTLAELRQRVYERLDDNGTYYTAAEVNRSLNAAQNIFAFLTLCMEREATFTTSAATCYHTVVDQLADYMVPLRVTTSAGARIHPATIHQLAGCSRTRPSAVLGT